MNFQEKLSETAAEVRVRAASAATAAFHTAREGATLAARRAQALKKSLAVLKGAGKELKQVAGRHVGRFVSENRAIAADAGRDLGTLARSTYASFATRGTKARAPRKKKTTRARRVARTI
jgi:hypothetical protein